MKRIRQQQCHISAYIDEALKKKAQKLADSEQRPLSAWLRRLITQAVEVRP